MPFAAILKACIKDNIEEKALENTICDTSASVLLSYCAAMGLTF
jgi:hypothetical protein